MRPRSRVRLLVVTLLVAIASATSPLVGASTADAAAGTDHLYRGEALYPGQRLVRTIQSGSRVELVMQTDGNLVLYNDGTATHGKRVCWASNTQYNGAIAIYQYDGNFVVYTADGVPTWASHTQNDGGTTVNINAYGQLWAGYKRISSFCQ
ncbi:MAG: hypothetical protein ABJA74_07920 [Lapillicoccus sp.]